MMGSKTIGIILWLILMLLTGYLVFTLLSAIPVLGWLVWLVAPLGGMGMLLLQLRASTLASLGEFANRSKQST